MKQITFIFIFILCSTSILAQTTVPGGDVSGTWSIASSPYNVQGNITIPTDSSLIIEPGVEVIFYGDYGLYAYGSLQAIGTETDSIYFAPADTTNGWGNIEIQYSFADFSYCSIRYSGPSGMAAVRASGSRLNISHCLISDNQSYEGGGLGVWNGSHVTVTNSSILRNYSLLRGGGIGLRGGSYLSVSNSTISYNQNSSYSENRTGGGIYTTASDSLIVTNCILSNNIAGPLTGNDSKGGAIGMEQFGSGGYVNISGCTFIDNSSDYEGGAIYLYNCTAVLNDNYFRGNSSIYQGVALSVDNCSLEVSHNTFDCNICLLPTQMQGTVNIDGNSSTFFDHCNFYNNGVAFSDIIFILSGTSSLIMINSVFSHHPYAIAMYLSGSNVSVEHCDFYNNLANFYGSVPAGLGTISSTNANGDPCDTFYNIFLDPLYIDPANGDFHLTENSPCIDAGDPASPSDPDGTIADIGAYYFHQLFSPDADFTADTTNGYVPLTINFTDLSTQGSGVIDEWLWDFGDGNNSALQNPANEYYNRGSYTISLTVTDDIDSTDTETKVDYITVLNSTPIVQNPITDFSFDEDTSNSSIDLNNVFDDADLPYGDILSFSYSGNTFVNVSIVSGIVTITPDPDWFGFEDITFTATDDSLESISDEVRITIDPVNDAPVINSYDPSYSPVTIDETESQLFWVSASDIDGDPLSYQWYVDDVPEAGQIDSTYTHTTDYASAGTYMIKCIADDGVAERTVGFSRVSKENRNNLYSEDSRATDLQEWQLIVIDVDQNIIVNDIQPPPGTITINEMDTINFFIDAYDPDGNPLNYSWELDGVEVSTDSTYLFETDYTSAGEYVVTLEVTDNFGTRRISGSISRNTLNYSWDVTVNDVDQPIVVDELIPPEGDITIDEGDVINFSIDAYDPDGNDLEYSWQVEGEEVSVANAFDFITDENSAGEYEVILFVTDNFSSRDELNFLWNVTVNNVSGSGGVLIPTITKLYQNHPNPFNPVTNIQFDIKENESGILTIFNMKGQIVASQRFDSGSHNYLWNAVNCSSGVYFYKLQTQTIIETRKMLLLK